MKKYVAYKCSDDEMSCIGVCRAEEFESIFEREDNWSSKQKIGEFDNDDELAEILRQDDPGAYSGDDAGIEYIHAAQLMAGADMVELVDAGIDPDFYC